jgi:hypothetical protein
LIAAGFELAVDASPHPMRDHSPPAARGRRVRYLSASRAATPMVHRCGAIHCAIAPLDPVAGKRRAGTPVLPGRHQEAVSTAPDGHIPFRAVVCGSCCDREDTMDDAITIRREVVPLTKRIGGEIRGIDLRDDLIPWNFFAMLVVVHRAMKS